MRKLKITKEELEKLYNDELNDILEQCDWITYVDSFMVCRLVYLSLKRVDEEIDEDRLHEIYIAKIESLNLKDGEWSIRFGIKEIIDMIYDIIEKNL